MRNARALAAALLLVPALAGAGELLDRIIAKDRASYFAPAPVLKPDADATELEPIVVYGQRSLWSLDPKLREAIPCLGCETDRFRPPLALEIAKETTRFLAKGILPQPRCRGEPNDEANYYALRASQDLNDDRSGFDRALNQALYNWAYDEKNCR